MAWTATGKAEAERARRIDVRPRRGPPGRPLRLRPLAFTAFAMVTVVGAVALAFYLVNRTAEDVFMDRERDAAISERQILTEVFELEGMKGLIGRMERRTRLAAPEAHYAVLDAAGRHIGGVAANHQQGPVRKPLGCDV